MITKQFALKLFDGFSIQRWNDRIKPIDFNEMDRCGHKMITAYFLGKMEEKKGKSIDWEKIIYGGFFELLKKIVLSDIKAPVHRRIKKKYPKEFKELNDWVVRQYKYLIDDKDLLRKFQDFMEMKEDLNDISFRVLRAAHKYSTLREFYSIKMTNPMSPNLYELEKELNSDIKDFLDLDGLQMLLTKQKLFDLMIKIEQLRYQVRWSQTQRIPKTSVLGHSMLVACISLMVTRELEHSKNRLYSNFFCGLFHDLPEAVTRDIISPVKRATDNLPNIVKQIEDEIVDEQLFPFIDDYFKEEIVFFTRDEFENRVIIDGNIKLVDTDQINANYNNEDFLSIDGELIKLADEIAAFLEAYQSIKHGISSTHLIDGQDYIFKKYKKKNIVSGIDVTKFFMEF